MAEILKVGPTVRLMGARGAVLPGAELRSTDPVRRSAQARRRLGIEIGVPYAVVGRAAPVT